MSVCCVSVCLGVSASDILGRPSSDCSIWPSQLVRVYHRSVCMYLFVCLYFCLSASICLFPHAFFCLFVGLSVCVFCLFMSCSRLSVPASVCLSSSATLSVNNCLCLHLFVCTVSLSTYFSICLYTSVCLFFCLSILMAVYGPVSVCVWPSLFTLTPVFSLYLCLFFLFMGLCLSADGSLSQ